MQWITASRASLAVSGAALFVALGGTAMAVTKIGTSGLRNGAVTNAKLHKGSVGSGKLRKGAVTAAALSAGSVTNVKLADNAVTSSKVADGSLTASDIAPHTFLPAGGTATNANELGGISSAGFVRGTGPWASNRIVVPVGQTATLLELNFAHIQALCQTGAIPVQRFVAELPTQN